MEKINNLNFIRTYPANDDGLNGEQSIEFTEQGIEIDGDLLCWDSINDAYNEITKTIPPHEVSHVNQYLIMKRTLRN